MRAPRFHPFTQSLVSLVVVVVIFQWYVSVPRGYAKQNQNEIYIVILQNQEQFQVAQQVKSENKEKLHRLGQAILQLESNQKLITDEMVQALLSSGQPLPPEPQERRRLLLEELDNLRTRMRQEILQRSAPARQTSQQSVSQIVAELGGEVIYTYQSLNALVVSLSAEALTSLENLPEVQEVFPDQRLSVQLNVSAKAIYADQFWSIGYTGGGVDVVVIDTGIDHNHPALASQDYRKKRCLDVAQANYPVLETLEPSADDVNGHGTHIAGIIASTNSTYRGVAYGLGTLINGKAGFTLDGIPLGSASMFFSDAMSCIDWALTDISEDAEVISYSFGGEATADDSDYERFWDAVVDQMGAVAVISAGNNGSKYNALTTPCIAYNVLCVANIDDGGTITRNDDAIQSSSSRGPTLGGRKKPDLSAPGTDIKSTYAAWESDSDFIGLSGTSMATPHVSGAAALLISRGVSDPLAVKALLINTAQDKGSSGWDKAYGWGYVDLANLNQHISDFVVGQIQARPAYHLYASMAMQGEAATLVWNRRAVYQAEPFTTTFYTLSDLDLYVYNEDNNGVIGSSLSGIDNVEQIRFYSNNPSAVIKVDAFSASIAGAISEDYALASGEVFTLRNGPTLELLLAGSGDLLGTLGSDIVVSLSVVNRGDLKAHNLQVTITVPSGLTVTAGPSLPASIPALASGESSEIYTWYFVKTSADSQKLLFRVTSNSYGETYSSEMAYAASLYLPMLVVQ